MMPPHKPDTKPHRIVALADGRVVRVAPEPRSTVVLRLVHTASGARRLREAEVWSRLGLDENGIRRQRRGRGPALSIVRK